MNRQMIITAVAFVVVGAIALALEQWVFHLQGAVLKLIIGIVVALIAGGVAFFVTKTPVRGQIVSAVPGNLSPGTGILLMA